MFRRLLSAAGLLLLLSAPAQAAPINLLLTVDIYAPDYGSSEVDFTFSFFTAASNLWPNGSPSAYLDSAHGSLMSGATQFSVSLETASLDNVYFRAYGGYILLPVEGEDRVGLHVAAPPDGHVPESTVYGYGALWIPLANLGDGLSGNLHWYYGYSRMARGHVGTWAIAPEVAPVPEPASMLLLGSGLAAVMAKRYRRR